MIDGDIQEIKRAIGQKTDTGNTDPDDSTSSITSAIKGVLSLLAGTGVIGIVGGTTNRVSVEFTRAANATGYDIGDIVTPAAGGVVTLANIARVNGGSGYITGIRLTTDKKSITPRFRIHFFKMNNPTLSQDNAAWQDKYADVAKRVGYWDMPAMTTGTDTTNSDMSRTIDYSMRIPYKCDDNSRDLYFVLEALDAFTPASGEKFSMVIYSENN